MTMIDNVREWLETQGYSLEMQTASAFRAVGFEVRQSTYYTDPETQKPREIDVQVIDRSMIGLIDVRFFVECKSGGKPWVLFCSADTLKGYNRVFAFGAMSKRALDFFVSVTKIQLLKKYPWFLKDEVVAGYSLRQAFSKEVDSAYAAAVSVAKASHNHVYDTKSNSHRLHFAFPVIVVDTPLIRCSLDASGQVDLQEVEQGEFLFGGHQLGTCIRIVTHGYLPTFAKDAKQVADQLKEDLKSEEDARMRGLTKGDGAKS